MRLPALVAAASVLLGGCIGLPSHEDRTIFHSEGAYEAAVAAGADVLQAREDPGVRGTYFPSLALTSPDLDEQWGAGRYALTTIHWWGPPGPPAPEADGATGMTLPQPWQGFILGRGQVQATLGDVPQEQARAWYDDLLRNLTGLAPGARQVAADDLFAYCGPGACTAPLPEGFDAARAWQNLGGLAAATERDMQPSWGRLEIDAWWFQFDWHEATLESWLPGGTTIRVGASNIVEFVWQSDRTHSDDVAYRKLVESVKRVRIEPPAAEDLDWRHQEIHYD